MSRVMLILLLMTGMFGLTDGGALIYNTVTRQWRISNRGFVSGGLMLGVFENQEGEQSILFPTLSYDYRF